MLITWQVGGNVAASLNSKSGNDNELLINFEGKINIDDQWNKNVFYWDFETEDDDGDISKEVVVGYSYIRYLDEHWYAQAAMESEHDSEDDPLTRTSVGGTLGYRFWETAETSLKTSAGISQLWEDYKNSKYEKDFALIHIFNYRTRLFSNFEYFIHNRAFFRLKQSTVLVDFDMVYSSI